MHSRRVGEPDELQPPPARHTVAVGIVLPPTSQGDAPAADAEQEFRLVLVLVLLFSPSLNFLALIRDTPYLVARIHALVLSLRDFGNTLIEPAMVKR